MIFAAFAKSLRQLSDARFRSVVWKGIGLSFALLIVVYAVFVFALQWLLPESFTLPLIGEITFVDELLSIASFFLMLVLSVFLMVPVASMFTGFFLDDVADAVEDTHYPKLPPANHLNLADNFRESLTFLGVLITANIVALALLVTPIGPFAFYGVNGFLLGREYYRMVAVRRLGREGAKAAFRKHLIVIWIAGILMAVPLSIPLINLLIPVLGVATFTHLYHRLERYEDPHFPT